MHKKPLAIITGMAVAAIACTGVMKYRRAHI